MMICHITSVRQQAEFACKCGERFKLRRRLIEHIGLLNPHWPRKSETDEHGETAP